MWQPRCVIPVLSNKESISFKRQCHNSYLSVVSHQIFIFFDDGVR
jgi:hypothetical protein